MLYKPLDEITYDEALKLLNSEDETELLLLPLRAGEHMKDKIKRLIENDVRGNATYCIGKKACRRIVYIMV